MELQIYHLLTLRNLQIAGHYFVLVVVGVLQSTASLLIVLVAILLTPLALFAADQKILSAQVVLLDIIFNHHRQLASRRVHQKDITKIPQRTFVTLVTLHVLPVLVHPIHGGTSLCLCL